MSKAVLVMDMPESCDMCEITDMVNGKMYCSVPGCGELVEDYISCRPDFCPLRPIPEKKETYTTLECHTNGSWTEVAIKALEEIQKYREIGTVEECRVAVEKQKTKKPTPIDYKKYMDVVKNAKFLKGAFWCPNCNHAIRSGDYCDDCGQKLDWSDEE